MSVIDHVAEALSLLATPAALAESIKGHDVSEEWVDDLRDAAARSIATAQAHATLALVEQARIANLVALDARGLVDAGLYESTRHPALDSMVPILRPDIAAALGIPTTHPEETP